MLLVYLVGQEEIRYFINTPINKMLGEKRRHCQELLS